MYFLMVFNLLFSVFALNSHDNRCSDYSLQKGEPKTCEKKLLSPKQKHPKEPTKFESYQRNDLSH